MIKVDVVRGASALETLKDEWRDLVSRSSVATPFQTWEWHSTWWKHYGFGKKFQVLTIRRGNDLIGLIPLAVSSQIWTSLRWSGGGPSDYLHPISQKGEDQTVTEAFLEFLGKPQGFDLIDLHQVRESRSLAQSSQPTQKIDQASCLVLDLPKTFDEYLKILGKSLRYDVRKLGKDRLATGKANIVEATPETVEENFNIFLEQHRARWRSRKLPGAFVGRSLRFHREWIHIASRENWLRLKVLFAEGTAIGAIYAMEFNGTLYYYQAGFDPAHKALSPGTVLVSETIRTGIEEGMTQFDFMRGAESYKQRWMPQHEFHNYRLIFGGKTASGALGVTWNDFANRLEMKVRAKLEGGSAS